MSSPWRRRTRFNPPGKDHLDEVFPPAASAHVQRRTRAAHGLFRPDSSSPTIKVVNVEPGHVYIARFIAAPNARWDVKVDDVTAIEGTKPAARRAMATH